MDQYICENFMFEINGCLTIMCWILTKFDLWFPHIRLYKNNNFCPWQSNEP